MRQPTAMTSDPLPTPLPAAAPPTAPPSGALDVHAVVPQAPARPRRKPPVALAIVLATGMGLGLFLDFQASGAVTAMSAQAGGPIVVAAARAPGQVAEVRVEEGAHVKAGDVLARLDDSDARTLVLQAEADLAAAQAALAASRANDVLEGRRLATNVAQAAAALAATRAAVRGAEATVGRVRSEYGRLQGLERKGLVSAQELETARVAIATARADADAARARAASGEETLRLARAGGAEAVATLDDVDVLRAQAKRAEALLAIARLRLGQVEVKAPIAGVVVRRQAHPGEAVVAGQPMLAVVDPARVWVTAYVDEVQAPRVREGAVATVRFDALPGKRFAGRVAFVSAATGDGATLAPSNAMPVTGLRVPQRVPVRVTLDAPDPAVRPGMSALVRIEAR